MEGENLTINKIYKLVKNTRRKYGSLKKCELHIHTPASYDYRLIEEHEYRNLTDKEILSFAEKEGLFEKDLADHLLENLAEYNDRAYKNSLQDKDIPFKSFKEYIAYMLIARKLYLSDIEVAVISDHNTINGYYKLKYVLEELFKQKVKGKQGLEHRKAITLFLGVEISCSEKNHLIAIVDQNKYDDLNTLLSEIIINEEDGTYLTSLQVMEEIRAIGGVTYLAHMNTSDFIGNKAYLSKLFNHPHTNIIGLTDLSTKSKDRVLNIASEHNKNAKKSVGFLYEGDAHSIEALGKKNTWIKFNNVDFSSLKKAINNHKISIYTEKPNKLEKYIKGMVVESGQLGFLKSNPINKDTFSSQFMVVDFSRDLNCIIGGRGTGKSTIINALEIATSLETDDLNKLKFVCQHKLIYVVFYFEEHDYVLRFIPQTKDIRKHYHDDGEINNQTYFESEKKYMLLSNHWVEIYKQIKPSTFERIPDKDVIPILQGLFRKGYSINNIVNQINSGHIGDFLKETILYGLDYKKKSNVLQTLSSISDNSLNKYLRENVDRILQESEKYEMEVNTKINHFNSFKDNSIRIVHSPKKKSIDYYLNDVLVRLNTKGSVAGTKLRWLDVERYISHISKEIGYINFLGLILAQPHNQCLTVSLTSDGGCIR